MNENFVKNRSSKQSRGNNKQSRFQKPKTRTDKSRFSQNTRQTNTEDRKMIISAEEFPSNLNYSSSDDRPINCYKTSYLANYFQSNVPRNCKNSTYELFIDTLKDKELGNSVIEKFNNNNFFSAIHAYLIKSGHEENKDTNHKLGSYTTPTQNNSWQFDRNHTHCESYRSSSEVFSDLELEVMSIATNCQELTKKTKDKKKLHLDEELFSEISNLPEDLKGYSDLSVQNHSFSDESYRPLNFSNGRVYLD